MARRMWKSQFSFYMLLTMLPLLALAAALLAAPEWLAALLFQSAESSPAFLWAGRLAGGALLFVAMALWGARSHPGDSRDLFFWGGIFYLALSMLFLFSPFLFSLSWSRAAPAAALFLPGSALQLAFASRNLLVRE
ncbi:MAG: hypothetical protein K1X75_07070 [Leptospirales bacterium]|nr:hypothetical protein [Leptospirales bacterium]